MKCPCCGGEMEGGSPEVVLDAGLTPLEMAIMTPLVKAYPRGMTARQLADIVYAEDPNGGPLQADRCIAVHMFYIRAKIKPLGWHVGGVRGRGTRYLNISRIDEETGAPILRDVVVRKAA